MLFEKSGDFKANSKEDVDLRPRCVRLLAPAMFAAFAMSALVGVAGGQETPLLCNVRGPQKWLASRRSILDSATVAVGAGVAKICYSRPRARGRVVYGGIVPLGKAWRTGANEPTTLYLSTSAEIAGVQLAAGRYLLMTIPGPASWGILFYTTDSTDDPVRRFQTMVLFGHGFAKTEALDDTVDPFTIRVQDVKGDPEFLLEWERLRVRVPVRPLSRLPLPANSGSRDSLRGVSRGQ